MIDNGHFLLKQAPNESVHLIPDSRLDRVELLGTIKRPRLRVGEESLENGGPLRSEFLYL